MGIFSRAGGGRLLALGASVLLTGTVLAAAGAPAHATTAVAHKITVTSPGEQVTNPLSARVDLAIKATDSVKSTLTYTAADLPPGLKIGKTTGVISGTVTTAYAGTVKVTVTDSTKASGSASFAWTAANTIAITKPKAQSTTVGTAVALAISAADDDGTATPLTWTATGLPAGLTISKTTGVITGTPTTAGADTVTVTVTDKTKSAASIAFGWKIGNLIKVTTPDKVISFWLGIPARVRITATDSSPAQALAFRATGLPAGLSINPATGVISGTPSAVGTGTATVTATDGTQSVGTGSLAWTAGQAITIRDPGRVVTTAGHGVSIPLTFTDKAGEKVALTAAGLPSGVLFRPNPPLIYGWPTAGTYRVIIHGHGALGSTDEMAFTLVANPAPDKGASGQIHLLLDGKCLQDPGNRTSDGTRPVISGCVWGTTERWILAADGTIRVNGRCLDITGTVRSAGTLVQLVSCGSADPRQLWVAGTRGELINPASGLCLTDPGSATRSGTVPKMGTCHVKPYEQWTLPAQPVLTSVVGSCADDHFSEGNNGAVVDMFLCNGTQGQKWSFRTDGTIRPGLYGSKCVTVRGKPGAVGTKLVLWACSAGGGGQRWTVSRTGGLSGELTLGGVCLAIPSMTAANAAQLVTEACSASDPRVHWHIG
jgi:hypothetical protein